VLLNGRARLPVCASPAPSRALQDCAGNMPRIWGELSRLPDGENRPGLARAVGLSWACRERTRPDDSDPSNRPTSIDRELCLAAVLHMIANIKTVAVYVSDQMISSTCRTWAIWGCCFPCPYSVRLPVDCCRESFQLGGRSKVELLRDGVDPRDGGVAFVGELMPAPSSEDSSCPRQRGSGPESTDRASRNASRQVSPWPSIEQSFPRPPSPTTQR
jgi:hypothetical protein